MGNSTSHKSHNQHLKSLSEFGDDYHRHRVATLQSKINGLLFEIISALPVLINDKSLGHTEYLKAYKDTLHSMNMSMISIRRIMAGYHNMIDASITADIHKRCIPLFVSRINDIPGQISSEKRKLHCISLVQKLGSKIQKFEHSNASLVNQRKTITQIISELSVEYLSLQEWVDELKYPPMHQHIKLVAN